MLRVTVQHVGDFFKVGYGGAHANHRDEEAGELKAFAFEGAFGHLGLGAL